MIRLMIVYYTVEPNGEYDQDNRTEKEENNPHTRKLGLEIDSRGLVQSEYLRAIH